MDEPEPEKRPTPKPTRLEEVRRIIEEYADDLREIIRKLRQRMVSAPFYAPMQLSAGMG